MKISKLSLGLGLLGLAVSAQAAVNYVGAVGGDVTTIINLNPLSVNGVAKTEAAFETLYGGDYSPAAGTEPATWYWAAADTFVLEELVFITGGNVYIESGSIVRGQPNDGSFNPGTLVIARGAKLLAPGNSSAPIVFTSASTTAPSGNSSGAGVTRATGANPTFWDSDPVGAPQSPLIGNTWGGIIICGNAPTNSDRDGAGQQDYFDVTSNTAAISNGTAVTGSRSVSNDDRFSIEGIPTASAAFTGGYDRFGGFNAADNSGILTYLSIRHGGANLTANNEINGLTMGAVGRGTTVNNIEIWGNTDDGVELFGGNVNLQNIAIFGVQDDGLDLDTGYHGTVQFLFIVAGSSTDKLGEWDGSYQSETSINSAGYATGPATITRTPFANYTIANATLVGNSSGAKCSSLDINDQASPRVLNSIIVNPGVVGSEGPIEIDNRASDSYSTTSNFLQGRAYFKGVTFSSPTYTTATLLFANGGSDASIRTEVAKAAYANNFNGTLGFVNVPTGGTLSASLEFDPRPVSITDGPYFEESFVGSESAYTIPTYRGAFDPTLANLWTADWTAADAYGLIVK